MSLTKLGKREQKRLLKLTLYEEEARSQGFSCIAGIDEAGRGPLAGPVVAAACIIPNGLFFAGINDSKQLKAEEREQLFEQLVACSDIAYGVGVVSSQEIDKINIYQATIQAMLQAVACLKIVPDHLLVDGLTLPHPSIPARKIIKGDALSQSIAAASVLAKVTRDRLMKTLHEEWPVYGFSQHKGYGTFQHLEALMKHGPCPIHRASFEPLKSYLAGNIGRLSAYQMDLFEEFDYISP